MTQQSNGRNLFNLEQFFNNHGLYSYQVLLPTKFDFQYSTMSLVLPFDIITLIIDIVGENEDTDLLKELSLVSHSFFQICSKHLFAAIELDDAANSSSKRGFVKLLKSRPEVVKYIRKLKYKFGGNQPFSVPVPTSPSCVDDDRLLSFIFPNFLQSIPHLNCLIIKAWSLNWKKLDSSLTSALLHLMHLPTINRIDLAFIQNFPLSNLIPCVNLLRLNIEHTYEDDDDSFDIVQSEVMPKLREFYSSESSVLTRKLLHSKMQDGRPAFNLMNLRRLSSYVDDFGAKSNIRYLLQNAKLLEELHLRNDGRSIVGLHDILSPIACTLKVLHLASCFFFRHSIIEVSTPARQLCEELEAMAEHNVLEALTCEIIMNCIDDFIGTIIQNVGEVLVKPGWSALRQVSFEVSCVHVTRTDRAKLEALRSLIDKYLSHLSKPESVQVTFECKVRII